jgi:hypothetical protein
MITVQVAHRRFVNALEVLVTISVEFGANVGAFARM